MANTRIYIVESPHGNLLINATSRAAAIAHVARNTLKARIPSQHEVFTLAASGVALECANGAGITDQSRSDLAKSVITMGDEPKTEGVAMEVVDA